MAKIKESEIVEQWSVLVEGAEGRQQEFYGLIEEQLKELQPPRLQISQEKVFPSLMRRFKGESKIFLIIKNKYFDGYIAHAGAEDYGKQLNISWYLVQRAGKFARIMSYLPGFLALPLYPLYAIYTFYEKFISRRVTFENMDLFDRNELSAFAGTVHHAVTSSSQVIASTVGFDFSKVDQKSKGFLNLN